METLLDRLRKNNPEDNARANRHAVAFLAHRDEIVAALKEGWSARKIWQQMTEDKTISMCYVSFCRHVKKAIPSCRGADAKGRQATPPADGSTLPEKPAIRTKPDEELKNLPEKERLEILKNEAFAAVRSKKPTGSLLVKPKSREEEHRELFGD